MGVDNPVLREIDYQIRDESGPTHMFGQVIFSGLVWENTRRTRTVRRAGAASMRRPSTVAPATQAAHPARKPRRERPRHPPQGGRCPAVAGMHPRDVPVRKIRVFIGVSIGKF
jgi:hypothetical protein